MFFCSPEHLTYLRYEVLSPQRRYASSTIFLIDPPQCKSMSLIAFGYFCDLELWTFQTLKRGFARTSKCANVFPHNNYRKALWSVNQTHRVKDVITKSHSAGESEYKVKLSSISLHAFESENRSDDKLPARIEKKLKWENDPRTYTIAKQDSRYLFQEMRWEVKPFRQTCS